MKKIVILVSVLSLLAGGLFSPGVSANAYTLLCRVDIGNEISEFNHNLQDWGPVEPFAHSYPVYNPWSISDPDFTGNARVIWGDAEKTNPCATLTLNRCEADGAARVIRIVFLDGIYYAGVISDDSFTVEVKNNSAPDAEYQLVFTWEGQFSRDWRTEDILLAPELNLDENGWIDVRLCATADMWMHHGSYLGQVAFDYIELWGETPVPCGECEGGVTELTLQYNGTTAADIVVLPKAKKNTIAVPLFDATVPGGGEFTFFGVVDKKGKMKMGSEITILVNGELHTTIHTSCSQPIGTGMGFGDFVIIDGWSLKGGQLCPIGPIPEPEPEACCKGGVTELTLRYNGDEAADIVVLPKAKKNKVAEPLFDEPVAAGGQFTFSGVVDKKGNSKMGSEITILVNGDEHTKIHTSCSQPIGIGSIFGDFVVIDGWSLKGGQLCPIH